jgi:ADP-ribose pyrophosphatase YjhB (NUDIX family)
VTPAGPTKAKKDRHAFCGACGEKFAPAGQPFPRRCDRCDMVTYVNPIPVAVLLVPVGDGLLAIRRSIEPGRGKLALPGGFIDVGETWQAAAVRELREETGIIMAEDSVRLFAVHSAPEGILLLFGAVPPLETEDALQSFAATPETEELTVVRGPIELAFPFHTRVIRDWFSDPGWAASLRAARST